MGGKFFASVTYFEVSLSISTFDIKIRKLWLRFLHYHQIWNGNVCMGTFTLIPSERSSSCLMSWKFLWSSNGKVSRPSRVNKMRKYLVSKSTVCVAQQKFLLVYCLFTFSSILWKNIDLLSRYCSKYIAVAIVRVAKGDWLSWYRPARYIQYNQAEIQIVQNCQQTEHSKPYLRCSD